MDRKQFLSSAVIYQISLRSFTREGTFRAAEGMLEHIRSAGVDAVYLVPFAEMERDMDRSGWSTRQRAAGFNSPKNPYRISNYNTVDPEYGSEAELKSFVDHAHSLGMKVIFDLVYLHCGPGNVIQQEIPGAFRRNPDGSVMTTIWHFPYLNFDSPAVREYLYRNMQYYAETLGCDGFRCDVGDEVPLDFWKEGAARLRRKNPGIIMLNEGRKPEYLKVFDANYGWDWSNCLRHVIRGKLPLSRLLEEQTAYEKSCPKEPCDLLFMENHDISNDDGEERIDIVFPVEAGNLILAADFLRKGIPVLFNGNEIADNSRITFFAPTEHERRAAYTVNWARALQPEGTGRLALVRELSQLRHTTPALMKGKMEYPGSPDPEKILTFRRKLSGSPSLRFFGNVTGESVKFSTGKSAGKILFSQGCSKRGGICQLQPFGFLLAQEK